MLRRGLCGTGGGADGEQGRTRELQQHRRPGTRGHFCVKLHLRPTKDDH